MTSHRGIVYLLDDDPGIIKALTRLLGSVGYDVRGYTSPSAFVEAWRPASCSCLVLDVTMPELNGLQLQRRLRHQGVMLPIVFLTGNGDIPTTVHAMKAGAVDFLTKPVQKDELFRAIESALARSLEEHETASKAMRLSLLTPREREVLDHVVTGQMNKQIASDLGTSIQNIKFHRTNIMKKMDAESLAELVRLAEKLGIGQAVSKEAQSEADS